MKADVIDVSGAVKEERITFPVSELVIAACPIRIVLPETETDEPAAPPETDTLPADCDHVHLVGTMRMRLSIVFVPSPATEIVKEVVNLAFTVNGTIEAVPVPFPPTVSAGSAGLDEF